MNLKSYFQTQKNLSLDPAAKVALYEKVVLKTRTTAGIFSRIGLYTKAAIYTSVGIIFLVSLYAPYFGGIFQNTDGERNGIEVQADYIGQIIEAK